MRTARVHNTRVEVREAAASPCEADVVDRLIDAARWQQNTSCYYVLSSNAPRSWARTFFGFISLLLLCSDIPRSGLGIRTLNSLYIALDPDTVATYTPMYYAVQKLNATNASTATGNVWSYKFDTTSIVWRAFAEFYQLDSFPPCVLYHGPCPKTTLSGKTIFRMLDSVANATAAFGGKRQASGSKCEVAGRNTSSVGPVAVTLRTENRYLDRLHHYLLPQVFANLVWRSNRAIYYSPELLAQQGHTSLSSRMCFGHSVRPFFCREIWTNLRRSCPPSNCACQKVGLVADHIVKRARVVKSAYPDAQVDLTVLESNEDLQNLIGGISRTGTRRADISTIIRARRCTHIVGSVPASNSCTGVDTLNCTTIFVDEYRYQVGIAVSDISLWYNTVAALRSTGQAYFILRIGMLALFCYAIQPLKIDNRVRTVRFARRVKNAAFLFAKIPVQSVAFGSAFPVLCYASAHLIDAPITYEVLAKKFVTQGGIFTLKLQEFLAAAFIQMRNVWIFAALLHVVVLATTSRWRLSWFPVRNGVLGVPEFFLSGLSSITVLAQLRMLSFRWAKVLSIVEVDLPTRQQDIKYRHLLGQRGSGNTQFVGVIIDFRFLVCLLIVVTFIVLLRNAAAHGIQRAYTRINRQAQPTTTAITPWALRARSPVPHSAGYLWPIVAMCVHWSSDYFFIAAGDVQYTFTNDNSRDSLARSRTATTLLKVRAMVADTIANSAPAALMSPSEFALLQFQMEHLHHRHRKYGANVVLVNLVHLSDPLHHWYYIRAGGGVEIGYYQSKRDRSNVVLLPVDAVASGQSGGTHDLKLLRSVPASRVSWSDLVQCG